MKTKILVFFIAVSLLASFTFADAQVVQNTATGPQLQALIQSLHQQIQELKQKIIQLQEQIIQIDPEFKPKFIPELKTEFKEIQKEFKFTQNLRKGLRGQEVENLQEFLSRYPDIYPEKLVTGYFGRLTEEAVKKFQEKYSDDVLKPFGFNKGTGFVGKKTIAKLNQLMSRDVPRDISRDVSRERRITICHYPPGNPDARHTIVINESALEAHLALGDTIGPCEDVPEPGQEPQDVCPNIYGIQETVPAGMILNDDGNCVEPEPGAILGCTDETATNYNSEATQDDGTCLYPDTTPPVISNFQPTGTITDFTPFLSLNTDENAICRYSITDRSFDTMSRVFAGAGATFHHVTIETMVAGTYTYYARCRDVDGNKNTNSASITFTIAEPEPEPEPEPQDVCPNIDGIQETIPNGMIQNNEGNCVVPEPDAILGCTDATATNYNSVATQDDGSCVYPDTAAPVISDIHVSNITEISATITWQTDEESDTAVSYGLTAYYGSTALGGVAVTYHQVNLSNLTHSTIYHYKVNSTDNAGNHAQSSDKIFTTLFPEPILEPEDVCPNIYGIQETIPAGMIRDNEGDCVVPEPEDVCPNIYGIQETIPAGMIYDNDGDCVEPESDAILGCTDATATNYDSEATQDDDSCVYPDTTVATACFEMTLYGECSTTKPKYCDNGKLIDNCHVCGCKSGYECQTDGSCIFPSVCEEIIQITTNTAKQINPKIYGNKIVWLDYRNGDRDTYMYDLSTGQETRITTISARLTMGRDIYGDKIVWADNRNGNYDIYMYDLSTGQETQITTSTKRQYYPAIYGNKIIWVDNVLYGANDIYMYDLSTGQETRITTNAKTQFSPDIYGDKIVWADTRNGNYDIYMYDLSTDQEIQITTNTEEQSSPAIHGDKIVWVDGRNREGEIYMYDLSTGQETRITTSATSASSFFPDIYGDRIVYKRGDIYTYDLSTAQETQITTSTEVTTPTEWYTVLYKRPAIHGDKIVWAGRGDGNYDIYMTTLCPRAPLTISDIQVSNITETSATITWQTDEESDTVVNLGLTASYGSTVFGETAATYHEVNLSNLTNGTTYHYKVSSTDNLGNKVESQDKTFATYAPPISWENVRVTFAGGLSVNPSMDWSGDGYGLAWKEGRNPIPYGAGADIYFVKLDADGAKITDEINLSADNPMRSFYPKIIWNGSEFGIIWEYRGDTQNSMNENEPSDCSLLFTRVDNNGVQQGSNIEVITRSTENLETYSSCPNSVDMVWDGNGYGVVWTERPDGSQESQIYFKRIDANGQSLTQDIDITQEPVSYRREPTIVWTGTEYGIVWSDSRDIRRTEIYFVRLDTAGVKQGSKIRITNNEYFSSKPNLRWNGNGYDLFWRQNDAERKNQIYFAKLDSSGNKLTNDIAITTSAGFLFAEPSFTVWDGVNYGITWTQYEYIYQDRPNVYFSKVDPNGSVIIPAIKIGGSISLPQSTISWSGSKYGIAWNAPPGTGGHDIYFASDTGELAISEQKQQLSFIERLLKDIQFQVASVSAVISGLLK